MMASCEEFELLISLGLDGELSSEEAAQLQDHLKSCPACCQLNQELSEIQSSISSLLLSPPPSLHTRIMEQISQEAALPSQDTKLVRPASFYRRYATTAAAVLVLVSALVFGSKLFPPNVVDELPAPEAALASPDQAQRSIVSDVPPQEATSTEIQNESPSPKPSITGKASVGSTTPPRTEKQLDSIAPPMAITSEPPPEPLPFTKEFAAVADTLTQEEAETLLIQYLVEDGEVDPVPVFSRLLDDSSAYLFQYTDSQGNTWEYRVSLYDGSIERSPISNENLSTLN